MTGPFRILLVDDDEVDRMAVRRALRSTELDTEVEEASDVASALRALEEGDFHCVLLDYQIPGGDGLRVLREARAAGIWTPVVMLTGHDDTQTAVELMKAGAADYLAKGTLSPERLERSLRGAVRLYRAEEQARHAKEALGESEARLRRIAESGMIGLLFWGLDGKVTDANDAFLRMTGFTRDDLEAGRIDWRRLTPPEWREADEHAVQELLRSGVAEAFEKEFFRKDGSRVPVLLSAATFEHTREQGVTLVLDISARKRAEREREHALQARNRFYATMSHELRTPINAILGYNDLLLSGIYGSLSEAQIQGLERSHRAARHLLELVNDVLDLSKLEAGKAEVQWEEVDLPEVISDLLVTAALLAEEQGSSIQLEDAAVEDRIVTDPRRVRQILLNLISNAIKYGGGRPVRVRYASQPDGGVRIEVMDQGPGIPADELPRIFEEFYQIPASAQGGTGLGLPISKRLAELLEGRLEVESEPGRGSIFRLILPSVPRNLEAHGNHATSPA